MRDQKLYNLIFNILDTLTNTPEKIAEIMELKSEVKEKTEEARRRMEEDLGDEDDHLDISLDEESAFLQEYLALLEKI